MKLTKETLAILQNFALINPNLVINTGDVIKTISESKSIIAEAKLNQEFPNDFGIYDLGEFLSTMGLVEDPELEFFEDKYVTLKNDNKASCRYFFSDSDILTKAPTDVESKFGNSSVTFDLKQDDLKKLSQACSTLKINKIKFSSQDGMVTASVKDTSNPTGNSFDIEVGSKIGDDFEFTALFSNLKFMPGDYLVSFYNEKIPVGKFQNTSQNVKYFVAFES